LPSIVNLSRRGNAVALGAGVCGLAVALLAIVMMSVNGFSPFIYFRF